MSLTKTQAQTQTTSTSTAAQSALDTHFIAQADLLIANQIGLGKSAATLTLTKGVSAANVMMYYQNLGYQVLLPALNGYGSDTYAFNGIGDGYENDDYNLDQPADLFGFFYDQFWNNVPLNKMICDGKTPSYLYLSWA